MKVLITGASGLLGKYLFQTIPEGIDAVGTWYSTHQLWTTHQMDICDKEQISYVFGKVEPDAVIHMAAVGSVDWCQNNYRPSAHVNIDGMINILEVIKEYKCRFLLTSTNAVYEGTNPPYNEESERNPVNVYGTMRKRAEDLVTSRCLDWQIARLFLLYGWEPNGSRMNWGSRLVNRLKDGKITMLVDDIKWQPTFAKDAAKAIWKILIEGNSCSAWNVAGSDTVDLFEFGVHLCSVFGLPSGLLRAATMTDFPKMAPRPKDSSYNLSKSRKFDIWCQGVKSGLWEMRDEHGNNS